MIKRNLTNSISFLKSDKNIILEKKKDKKLDIENIFKKLIDCIKNDDIDILHSYKLAGNLSQNVIELIWKEINIDKNKSMNPVFDVTEVSNFLEDNNLPKEFYPYYHVNFFLMEILKKSNNYISIEDKFSLYVKNANTIQPEGIHKIALDEIYSKVKNIVPLFDEKKVIFKKFEKIDTNFCYFDKDKNINFSTLKLQEPIDKEWKFWVYVKILKFLDVKIEDNYKHINGAFENKRKSLLEESGAIV